MQLWDIEGIAPTPDPGSGTRSQTTPAAAQRETETESESVSAWSAHAPPMNQGPTTTPAAAVGGGM